MYPERGDLSRSRHAATDNQLKMCLRSVKNDCKDELQGEKSHQQSGAGTTQANPLLQPGIESGHLIISSVGKVENPADVPKTEKSPKKRRPRKVARKSAQTKEAITPNLQESAANPAPAVSASAVVVAVTQEAEAKVSSPSPSRPRKTKRSSSSPQKPPKPELISDLTLKMQSPVNEKPSYQLAVSLVPLLDEVPEENMMALRRDLVNLIISYYPNAPPNPSQLSSAAPPPSSARK